MDVSGFVGSSSGSSTVMFTSPPGNEEWRNKECLVGSGLVKQGRRGGLEENEWRYSKVGRVSEVTERTGPLKSNSSPLFCGQQMVSFSSVPKQDGLMLCNDETLPYQQFTSSSQLSSSSYGRTSGMGSGSSFSVNVHGVMGLGKSAFTPSQWMELEHQAIIYKCIDANVPIPPSLIVSIQRSLNHTGYTGYPAASLRPNGFGWGSFPSGFSSNSDPEPGRCRRTDGKKWRCSRDAVIDQKYCERHLNRGRHRSRKPVEGQSGHGKAMPTIINSPTPAASTICSSGLINNITNTQQDMKNSGTACLSATPFHRISTNEDIVNHPEYPATDPGTKTTPYIGLDQQRADFCLTSSVARLNPSKSSTMENITFAPMLLDKVSKPNSIKHFMDNWSKTQSYRSTSIWPDIDESQLSISVPKDMSSSSFSQERTTLSFLKQSQASDQIHMGLSVGNVKDNVNQRQSSWGPVSWEGSVGGPLGEVLNSNMNSADNTTLKNNTTLNLLTYGWDTSILQPDSSPTGVLQKTTFGSLSSSAGSSPRAGSFCEDLLGSVS